MKGDDEEKGENTLSWGLSVASSSAGNLYFTPFLGKSVDFGCGSKEGFWRLLS